MATLTKNEKLIEIARLETLRQTTVAQLDFGAQRIEEKRRAHGDSAVVEWEKRWLLKMNEYERTCERIRELQAEL